MLPLGVSFVKQRIGPGCWAYQFHHDQLGMLGRVVLTKLPDDTDTHISCELAENLDGALTDERRHVFEPLALEIGDRLGQAFAHRIDGRS